MAKFDALAAMEADGIKGDRIGCMSDDRFYYRINGNEVQVGVRSHFDRWANSIDFMFSLPKSERRWIEIKGKLNKAMRQYKGGLGEEQRV